MNHKLKINHVTYNPTEEKLTIDASVLLIKPIESLEVTMVMTKEGKTKPIN